MALSFQSLYYSFKDNIQSCSSIEIALSVIILIIVLYSIFKMLSSISEKFTVEGMENNEAIKNNGQNDLSPDRGKKSLSMKYMREKYKVLKGQDIYDPFYVSIYDSLFSEPVRIEKDVNAVLNNTKYNSNSSLLDIGSGTGLHVRSLHETFKNIKGLDKSLEMTKLAKKRFPYIEFQHGDAMDNTLFQPSSFSHITMFYFTFYVFHDTYGILHNIHTWLKPGGYFVVHLVNRKMFDPILSIANPINFISIQKHAEKRLTTSDVKFNDFRYKSEFKLDDVQNSAIFEETFKHSKTGNIRKHIHTSVAPKLKIVIDTAEKVGFKVLKKISMVDIQYEYQYLYVFQKKN